jgi:hypothetical protein
MMAAPVSSHNACEHCLSVASIAAACISSVHQAVGDVMTVHGLSLLVSCLTGTGPWPEAVNYFSSVGFPCPQYKNPTDVFMALASDASSIEVLAKAFLQVR